MESKVATAALKNNAVSVIVMAAAWFAAFGFAYFFFFSF